MTPKVTKSSSENKEVVIPFCWVKTAQPIVILVRMQVLYEMWKTCNYLLGKQLLFRIEYEEGLSVI
jgi:hypothetical protein